jgi:methyl-accepting chemotaxis protein
MNQTTALKNGHSKATIVDTAPLPDVPYREVLEQLDAREVYCDASMTIQWMNAAAARDLGEIEDTDVTPEELVGSPLDEIVKVPTARRRTLRAGTLVEIDAELGGRPVHFIVTPIKRARKVAGYAVEWHAARSTAALPRVQSEVKELLEAVKLGHLGRRANLEGLEGAEREVLGHVNDMLAFVVGLIDSLPSPVLTIDREFRIAYMNEIGAAIGGRTPKEVVGTKCYDHFRTSDCKTDRCACQRAMTSGAPASSETDAHPGKLHLQIAYNAAPLRSSSGVVTGAFETVNDQTAAKTEAARSAKVTAFRMSEAAKLASRLSKCAVGDFDFDLTVADADADTAEAHSGYASMATATGQVRDNLKAVVTDAVMLAQAAVDGKLGTRADASRHQGEYRKIIQGVNDTIDAVVGPLKLTAEQASAIAESAESVTAVSTQMAGTATETTSQAGVVSAAAEQVSRNLQTVSTSAEEMTASIREIAKSTNEATRVATSAVKVAESTNTSIAKLGESSAEIGKVIKVITSIAQQTNLLALNATIEAARAGEAGKGFAVVANEVKELAKQTAHATEDISQKIEAIQSDTRGAVAAIAQISSIIGQINDIQSSIASSVEEQTATTNEIARNVMEGAKGSTEIAENINSVASAAKETTVAASNVQRAARGQAEIAAKLQAMVARFTF